ncbi:MAG TPA: iron uptake porin [Stenomitos sp.]
MFMRLATLGLVAATVLVAVPPAVAFTPVSELKDVTPDHWAYNAIKALVEKYQVMEGFPDNTFRGTRTISRYELAAALAKVMARVEEMVAAATGEAPQPTRIQPSVSPDDLRTIARLQQEFKDELTGLKARVDTQDSRLSAIEKRIRVGGSLDALLRTYTAQPVNQANEREDLRIATNVTLDANMSPELSYRGQLSIFNSGVQRFASGHLATEGGLPEFDSPGDTGTPMYVRRSYFSWTPAGLGVHVGMMTFSDTLKIGSTLRNEFRSAPLWPHAEGGYGFVGTPPLQPPTSASTTDAGTLVLAPALSTARNLPTMSGRIHWNPGVNVAEDLLDPNSVWAVNTGSAPSAVVDGFLGPVELGAGLNYGTPGASSQLALSDLPRTFPLISEFYRGYALGKIGLDLGVVRWGAYLHSDGSALREGAGFVSSGRGYGTTLDIGSDALGLSFGHSEVVRRDYDPNYYSESSAFLVSNSLFGTGIGLGIGAKLGNSPAADTANSLVPMAYDWTSTGAYVRLPGFSVIPSVTLAAQTSGRDLMGSELGSGLSAIAELQIAPGLPAIMIEYDMGRFYGTTSTPAPGGDNAKANQLFGGAPLPTHEQLVVGTTVQF